MTMDKLGFRTRDLVILAASIIVAGTLAGVIAGRSAGQSVSLLTKPLSDCEAKCIKDFPDDTEKRLNCMLKCVADGKLQVQRVLLIR